MTVIGELPREAEHFNRSCQSDRCKATHCHQMNHYRMGDTLKLYGFCVCMSVLLVYRLLLFNNSVIFKTETLPELKRLVPCYGTFCRPCTICRRRQIVSTLAAHFVASMHNLTPGDKMCRSGTYGVGATKCAV